MCLLSFTTYGVIEYDTMRAAAVNNPDGFGFAVHYGDRIVTGRGLVFDKVYADYVKAVDGFGGSSCSLFHHRWATSGDITKANAHPFFIGEDRLSVIAHNGVLAVDIPKGDKRSDTRIYAEEILPSWGGACADFDEIEQLIGADNKLVILSANDDCLYDWQIVGEAGGHWDTDTDTWFSNYSYLERVRVPLLSSYSADWYESTRRAEPSLGRVFDFCAACGLEFSPLSYRWQDSHKCRTCHACQWCGEASLVCECF